jgi:hypothetical protein
VGFQSAFSGKAERVEIWVRTMVEMRNELVRVAAEEIRAVDSAL